MPPLASTRYIRDLAAGINGCQPAAAPVATEQGRLLFDECLAALAKVGIQTDYDLLLQSDILDQTPAALHQPIRALRMAVLEHFASAGSTAADLLSAGAAAGSSAAIRSGLDPLDALLDGGLLPGTILEVCGEEASSKTRVAVEFAVGHLVPADPRTAECIVGPRVFMLQSSPLAVWVVEQSLRKRLEGLPEHQRDRLLDQAMGRLVVVDCIDLDALLAFLYYYVDTYAADMAGGRNTGIADLLIIDSIRPLVIGAMQQHDGGHIAIHAARTALRAVTRVQRIPPAAVLITNGISQHDRFGGASLAAWADQALTSHHTVQPSLGPAWALVSHTHVHLYAGPPLGTAADAAVMQQHQTALGGDTEGHGDYVAVVLKSPRTYVGRMCRFSLR